MQDTPARPLRRRRSVLYMPAGNARALAKADTLDADTVIFDLEDSVDPAAKDDAREALRTFFRDTRPKRPECVIRINALAGPWGTEDLLAARACMPDAILLPKVDDAGDIRAAAEALAETDAPQTLRLWAMAETPRFLLNAAGIADFGRNPNNRLDCFVTGTNDLVKETGISAGQGRQYLQPLLTQIVIAARAGGLDAIDGVYNDFRDEEGFTTECAQGAALGFDGKSLIHPAQIETANAAFSPSPDEIATARAIADAFARPENAGKGVISLDGRMVERLHLAMAEKLLARAGQ
ncbi:MAG: CoA ester lyase [Brucellaceae bacterium]|nr:CoA ester lyase [Brucellaceae bacterium]